MPTLPRVLFAGLVDDAALFPPGNAPMPVALAQHAMHREAWYSSLIGPFLCPASRVEELTGALAPGQSLDVSLVFDVTGEGAHDALRAVGAHPRLRLAAVEAAHARLGDDAARVGENLRRLPGTMGYLEVSRRGFDRGLDVVGAGGWRGAKYRTGGVTAADFPLAEELAAFIAACVARGLPFKLTAGLHHAIRQRDPATGFAQFGVLNVLAAVAAALQGSPTDRVTELLDLREPDLADLADGLGTMTADEARRVRQHFRSFGCCGVTDPVGELAALGLIGGQS